MLTLVLGDRAINDDPEAAIQKEDRARVLDPDAALVAVAVFVGAAEVGHLLAGHPGVRHWLLGHPRLAFLPPALALMVNDEGVVREAGHHEMPPRRIVVVAVVPGVLDEPVAIGEQLEVQVVLVLVGDAVRPRVQNHEPVVLLPAASHDVLTGVGKGVRKLLRDLALTATRRHPFEVEPVREVRAAHRKQTAHTPVPGVPEGRHLSVDRGVQIVVVVVLQARDIGIGHRPAVELAELVGGAERAQHSRSVSGRKLPLHAIGVDLLLQLRRQPLLGGGEPLVRLPELGEQDPRNVQGLRLGNGPVAGVLAQAGELQQVVGHLPERFEHLAQRVVVEGWRGEEAIEGIGPGAVQADGDLEGAPFGDGVLERMLRAAGALEWNPVLLREIQVLPHELLGVLLLARRPVCLAEVLPPGHPHERHGPFLIELILLGIGRIVQPGNVLAELMGHAVAVEDVLEGGVCLGGIDSLRPARVLRAPVRINQPLRLRALPEVLRKRRLPSLNSIRFERRQDLRHARMLRVQRLEELLIGQAIALHLRQRRISIRDAKRREGQDCSKEAA